LQYAIQTLWFERRRYMAGMLAVAFSAVLMAVQGGVLVGLVATVSAPVDVSEAQIWIAAKHTPSADNGGPISNRFRNRLLMIPDVAQTDEYVQEFTRWWNPRAGTVLVILCGQNLSDRGLGPLAQLSPELMVALSEPGAVAIDRTDKEKLGVEKLGDVAEIHGYKVRVVGFLNNMPSMTGCYVFCSIPTAKKMLFYKDYEATYILARATSEDKVAPIMNALREIPDIDVLSKNEFSAQSRWYWILKTKSGLAVGFTALLGLLVGAVVTSQTLYSATASMLRELAVLKSLGVPGWRMNLFVLQQSLVIGLVGLAIGLPLAVAFQWMGILIGTQIDIPMSLLAATAAIVLGVALGSGLLALRSLFNVDPAELLR
jgi:putative ABC transport system permease protein